MRRQFTPRTAREAVTRLRDATGRMCRLYRTMESLKPATFAAERPVAPDYFDLLNRLRLEIDTLRASGAEVKDVATGLLDFPARRDGRPVLLCWKFGEETIEFWHEAGDGFSGRRRVDEDGPWEGS
jgi:hypothetical protein